jgi:hypothetical protein
MAGFPEEAGRGLSEFLVLKSERGTGSDRRTGECSTETESEEDHKPAGQGVR